MKNNTILSDYSTNYSYTKKVIDNFFDSDNGQKEEQSSDESIR